MDKQYIEKNCGKYSDRHKDTAETDPLTLHWLGLIESYIISWSLHLIVTWHKLSQYQITNASILIHWNHIDCTIWDVLPRARLHLAGRSYYELPNESWPRLRGGWKTWVKTWWGQILDAWTIACSCALWSQRQKCCCDGKDQSLNGQRTEK